MFRADRHCLGYLFIRKQVLDRCLKLETEVTQIPVLRRQLEGYRRSKTEMEMTNREQVNTVELILGTERLACVPDCIDARLCLHAEN